MSAGVTAAMERRMMGLKAVLFDLGSTLIEFENHPWDELVSLGISGVYDELQRRGAPLPPYERFHDAFLVRYNDFWSRSFETWKEVSLHDIFDAVFLELGLDKPVSLYPRLVLAHYQPISAQTHLFDDVPPVLAALRERGLKLGIVSNTPWPGHAHLRDLDAHGLTRHFDAFVFSSELGIRKPHARIFKLALQALRVEPREAIYVGDRYVEDIWGPQQIGMKGILREHARRKPEPGIIPDARITTLHDLLPLIDAQLD